MNIDLRDNKYLRTFREISKDKNVQYDFIDSDVEGIDFDKVKENFQAYLSKNNKTYGKSGTLKSCDALQLYDGEKNKYTFIEFKNAKIDKKLKFDINKKIIHSCFILENVENKFIFDLDIDFILVYSESKNEAKDESKGNDGIPNSHFKDHFGKLAENVVKFDVDTLNLMIGSSRTMTEKQFEQYIDNA